MRDRHDTDPVPSGNVRAHGRGWSVVIPTAIVCALITAATNLAMRSSPEAHAATSDDATRADLREIRKDMKEVLERVSRLEDAVNNQAVIDGAHGRGSK
jgi:hypothetical protein